MQRPQNVGAERLATCQGLPTAIARTVWVRVLRHRCLFNLDEPYLRNPPLSIVMRSLRISDMWYHFQKLCAKRREHNRKASALYGLTAMLISAVVQVIPEVYNASG